MFNKSKQNGADLLKKNTKILLKRARAGIKGKDKIPIRGFTKPLTNRCNAKCIMCRMNSKEVTQRNPYYIQTLFDLSLEEYKSIFPSTNDLTQFTNDIAIELTGGEVLLNKDIFDIVKHTKTILPNSSISFISNGSIPPPKDEIVNYIAKIGFSIDGCTAETFEAIRTPLKFSRFLETIEKWIAAKKKHGSDIIFRFAVTLSSMNIHELPGIFKLAHEFGEGMIESIYVHALRAYEELEHLKKVEIDNISDEVKYQYIGEAYAESLRTGIRFDAPDIIRQYFEKKPEITPEKTLGNNQQEIEYSLEHNKYCLYMWNGFLRLDKTAKYKSYCCVMQGSDANKLTAAYNVPVHLPPHEVYNSTEMWKLRKDMLEGKHLDICANCRMGSTYYEQLKKIDFSLNPDIF